MSIQPELKTLLRRLKLSGMLPTLPDRLAYARTEKLDYAQLLELVLSDEVERRDQKHVTNRLTAAGFEEECTLERFDWSAKIRIDKARQKNDPFKDAFTANWNVGCSFDFLTQIFHLFLSYPRFADI